MTPAESAIMEKWRRGEAITDADKIATITHPLELDAFMDAIRAGGPHDDGDNGCIAGAAEATEMISSAARLYLRRAATAPGGYTQLLSRVSHTPQGCHRGRTLKEQNA